MLKKHFIIIVLTLCSLVSYAQIEIKGAVYDEYLEPFYNAKVQLANQVITSNDAGQFSFIYTGEFPVTLKVSAFGHRTEEFSIQEYKKSINIILKENLLLDQIVISASRLSEKIIESPVTIERFGINDIQNISSNSFYDALVNLKGVQSREGSYGFKSINTRGFSDFSNSRFVQMIDGMDTAAQALSFSTGNFSGVSPLDILSVEILPGASSALYGANAYNGLMLMNTKNPFDYTGITTLFKTGYTSQKQGGNNPFYDASIRMAYKFNDYFAAKVNFSYYQAEEWHANDMRNKQIDSHQLIAGNRQETLDYNGVNIYGDEMFTDLAGYNRYLKQKNPTIQEIPFATHLSRTGYTEAELLKNDFQSNNARFSTSLYFRPFKNERLEIQLATRLSLRNNLFQGATRFVQRNYGVQQYKLQIKGDNFFLRGYYTQNDAGNSYDLTKTGITFQEKSLSTPKWMTQYVDQRYLNGKSVAEATKLADANKLQPNTNAFNKELNNITTTLISEGGGGIYEKSNYKHLEGNYNFKSLLNNWADIQAGASYRKFNPNSRGTLFNDYLQKISIEEYGFYSQIQKKLWQEKLKITASIRYDKATNFDGNYSPKLALNYAFGKDKNNVFRTSFQTGFRNPTVQEQYQFLASAFKTTIGTVKDNLNRISHGNNYYEVWDDASNSFLGKYRPISGKEILNNSLLTKTAYGDDRTYQKSDYKEVVPELVKTLELGYRSMFRINNTTNFDLDINGYYSKHDNFVFTQDVVVVHAGKVYPYGNRKITEKELLEPKNKYGYTNDAGILVFDEVANRAFSYGDVKEFKIITNSKSQIESYGFALGMHTKLFKSFDIGLNYSFNDYQFEDKDNGQFEPNFNTPKHSVKVQFGNAKLYKNFGFNINARWQDEYKWVSTFVKGDVSARTVLDAQVNYHIPSTKSKIKIGGTNLFGKDYFVAPGSGQIGQLYYISWSINN